MEDVRVAVLAKATRLVDALAARGGDAAPLSALARAAGLPLSTAGRLMRDLVALGWADQPGRRGDYRLGPRARTLGLAQRHRGRFFAAARERLPALAQRLRAAVSVACLRGRRRCLLHEWLPDGGERRPVLEEDGDLWVMAGGRLLAAFLPAAERRALVAAVGLPGPTAWPGVANRDDLAAELAWIRRQNLAFQRLPQREAASAAVAVPDGDGGLLALGFWVPRGQLDEGRIAVLRQAGRELSALLG